MCSLARRLCLVASFFLLACGGSSGVPVTGLRITEVAIYQGVKISLLRDGQTFESPEVPVVRGRSATMRAFVIPDAGWQSREVRGRLEVFDGTKKLATIEARATIGGASSDADLASTFNFDLSGAHVGADLRYAVALFESKAGAPKLGTSEGSVHPATGEAKVTTQDAGKVLKVVLVPMRYKGDGSDRLPNTSAPVLQRLREHMRDLYPIPDVEVTVREPVDLTSSPLANGQGWGRALSQLLELRRSDRALPEIYYYGLFQPAASFARFCTGGCITGLSTGSQDANDATVRGSIGVGFESDGTYSVESTFVHELGHAHGRDHSPCGLGGQPADGNYPHRSASIGVWGYSASQKTLLDPGRAKDFMSYCGPTWVSDYTYRALFDRISWINAGIPTGQALTAQTPTRFRMLTLDGEGLWVGGALDLHHDPKGIPLALAREGRDGAALPPLTARFYPFHHVDGGILLVPDAALAPAHAVSLQGQRARLPRPTP
jgi:hypothetical protein